MAGIKLTIGRIIINSKEGRLNKQQAFKELDNVIKNNRKKGERRKVKNEVFKSKRILNKFF